MKYVICGTLVPEQYETEIEQLSNAANRYLMNLAKGLRKNGKVRVLSYLGIDVPKNVMRSLRTDANGKNGICYFKKSKDRLSGILRYRSALKCSIRCSDWAVAYNAVYAWLDLPLLAGRYGKKSMLVLADFSPEESCGTIFRKLYARMQLKSVQQYDAVIGLSENTQKYVRSGQKFICMEGGIDKGVYDYFNRQHTVQGGKLRYMYAGILEKVTGIDLLLKAFLDTESRGYELWISGKGSLLPMVLEAAAKDRRIRYLGCVPYQDYLRNLNDADVLVNPRNMNFLENANNFPSKIMEYLATGKPVISTKFPGWERYGRYIDFCSSSEEDIRLHIERMAAYIHENMHKDNSWEARREFARQFLWENQIKKIAGIKVL